MAVAPRNAPQQVQAQIETDTNHMTRSILHEIDVKNINQEKRWKLITLIAGKLE